MLTLGISGNFSAQGSDFAPGIVEDYLHDSAACLIKDSQVIAAVEEERLNRIKKTNKFPINAIEYCCNAGGVSISDVDAIAYYFREDLTDMALNQLYLQTATIPAVYSRALIKRHIDAAFRFEVPDNRIFYIPHHTAHAASSFVRSAFDEALVVVMDGQGEEESGSVFYGSGGRLQLLKTYPVALSLGLLYEDTIKLLGYKFGDEYKVMALAPYGSSARYKNIFQNLYRLEDEGEYYFNVDPLVKSLAGLGRNFVGPTFFADGLIPRRKNSDFDQGHFDLAAGLQETLEDIALHVLRYWASYTGLRKLCFTGGVAHNSSLNGTILRSELFHDVFVHPASHDPGACEGAALAAESMISRKPLARLDLPSAYLGPDLGDDNTIFERISAWQDLIEFEQSNNVVEDAVTLLAEGKVIAWAQGRSEFGPRALGNRSIIADPRPGYNQSRINSMVKKRESFRPFAPVVIAEAMEEFFEIPGNTRANYSYMSYVVPVREEKRGQLGAVTHVDGTARVQVVKAQENEIFHQLVTKFGERTGTPVLLNTSLNNNSEPIAQTVDDVVTTFLTTNLDSLVIGNFLVCRRNTESITFDRITIRFRPVTRLSKYSKAGANADTIEWYEIYLNYDRGPRREISKDVYEVLERVDSCRTVKELIDEHNAANDDIINSIVSEILELWEDRYVELIPVA